MYARTALLIIFIFRDVVASFLRVESGRQRILIDGRDPYVGFFTHIQFNELTCITAVSIHCLKPLTGAEELDILYSECERDHWKVAHYTNTKEKFTFRNEVIARQLSISSPLALSIIDVQVESCGRKNLTIPHGSCRPSRIHPRRHGRQKTAIRAKDYERRRRKRSIEYVLPSVYRADASPYEIPIDVVIPHDRTVVIQPGVNLRFADDTGFTVHGVLIVNGTKSAPVMFEPRGELWKGLEFINAEHPSLISYANISGSLLGITVRSGVPPLVDNAISTSNQYGFDIKTTSNVRITNSSAMSNEKTGFRISTKGDVHLDNCLSASNRENGFRVESNGTVFIADSHSFSNDLHGILLRGSSPSTVIQKTLISSSGKNGIRVEKSFGRFSTVKIHDVTITGHYYSAAVEFEDVTDMDLEMNSCSISDNFNGVISLDGITANSTVTILSSNFTRNRGTVISMALIRNTDVILHGNLFSANHLNDFGEHEAVVDIATFAEVAGSKIHLEDNQFEQNTMNNVLELRHLGGRSVMTTINKNNFVANLARSVVDLDMPRGEIKGNYFSNVQSACEISRATPVHEDAVENYWGHEKETDFLPRICALNRSLNYEVIDGEELTEKVAQTSAAPVENTVSHKDMAVPAVAAVGREGSSSDETVRKPLQPFENTYNQVKAISEPYSISSEVAVYPGQIVIVEPGTQFQFAPGIGITVQERGKLYLNGTATRPVRLFGEATWRGLVVKPGGTLVLSHTTIDGASIGLWIDSEKVQVERAKISDSVVHGVEITANAGTDIDLGHSEIISARGSGIGVDERKTSLSIRNVAIRDGWGTGIDFLAPTDDVQIENVLVSNGSSYAIHIVEFPASPLKSVQIRNITVVDQSRGHAGVLVSTGWAEEVNIDNSLFTRNIVPSLIIALECHEQPSRTRLTNSSFINNEETVVHIDVGECGAMEVSRNTFEENNNSGKEGVMVINAEPREGSSNMPLLIEENEFAKNGGEFSAMLTMHGSHAANGSFRQNRLHDNINSVASVVLTSPHYRLESNDFSNPLSAHEVDIRSDGSWKLQANNNKWGTDDVKKAFKAPESSLPVGIMSQIQPAVQPNPAPIVPESDYSQCAHLNFCSRRGRCEAGVCKCPPNYLGLDCSIATGCPGNCSNNGVCEMNKCVCYDGWTSVDCSTPICRFDCHGHGKCVSRNECECSDGWSGEFCDELGCRDGTCAHGTCVASKCQCTDGWNGTRCSIPICSNCSINGQCVGPEQCRCFDGYEGADCSICGGSNCLTCDFDCVHGTCERETRTCSCSRGWSGAACDVCRSANCQVKSSVLYIMPSTADKEDTNVVVNVFGTEFPKTPSSAYTCIFGASYADGQRISSSLVRCRVPKDLNLGRHLFNLAPENSISVIPNFDVRPIHFTVYEACSPTACKGVCVGPLCVCPKGTTGINCELIEIIPSIDRRFIENQKASTASEDSPYIVVLPTMKGSLHRVNSTIGELRFDSSRGIIEWAEPVGSTNPYEITVVSSSLSGESSISWNVSVQPSYIAEVNSVSKENGTNEMKIVGRVQGIKNGQSVPVKIWIKGKNEENPTGTIIYSNGTKFTYDYIPQTSGEFTVVASHPGVSPSSEGVAFDVPPLQLAIDVRPTGAAVHDVERCDAVMLRPQNGSISLDQTLAHEVSIRESAVDWTGETVSVLHCDGKRELFRSEPHVHASEVTAIPSAIALTTDSSRSRSLEVVIYRNGVFLRPPITLTSSDNSQPVFVIATDPDIDQINADTEYDTIKLALGQNADYKESNNVSLQLVADGEVMLRVPIYFLRPSAKLTVNICLRDAYEQQTANAQEAAVLSVSNTLLGVDDVRSNLRVNQEYVQFSLPEGFYQITAKAPNYRTVSEIVHISPVNTSFCVSMEAVDPRSLVTISEQGVSVKNMKGAGTARFPQIDFAPSSINRSDSRVLVSVTGSVNGLLSIGHVESDIVHLTPSVRSVAVNTSFWMDVEWRRSMVSSPVCNAWAVSVPYLFLADGSRELQQVSTRLVVAAEDVDYKQWKVCDGSNNSVPAAYSTKVSCDCSQAARGKCRQKYKSAAACGSAWKRISDDTVSLQVLSTYFLLLTDCKSVHVNMTELDEAMQCVSSLESECPILHRRRRSVPSHSQLMQADGPVDVINHLSKLSPQVSAVLNPMLPVLNALDMQSIRMATLYSDFVQRIQKIFPPSMIDPLTNDDVEKFLQSISDSSELGVGISNIEAGQFQDKALVDLWNATVNDWSSGRMDSPSENQGISYSDVKQLVVTADRLHSVTRQNGASDPFSLLHEYVGQILTTNDSREEQCLSAAVIVDPVVVYEDSSVTIDVYIQNIQDTTITNIDLSIDFVRNDMFAPRINFGIGPSWSAGINTMNGFGILAAHSTFEMHWTRKIIAESRLTASAFYQVVIVLGFHKNGVPSKQRLKSPLIEIRPRRSARILHFVNGNITDTMQQPFSAMTAVMNIGYSTLSDVRVLHTDINMVTSSAAAPFDIVGMELDSQHIGPTLSHTLGDIKSGTSKRITYHITTPGQPANIVNMSLILSVDGQLLPVEDEHTYAVKAGASEKGGFIVSSLQNPEPVYFYRPDIGSIVNIVPLQYAASETKSFENMKKTTISVSFRNSLSPGFTGALWGTFKLPQMPDNYRLTRVVDQRGTRTRVATPVTWTEDQGEDKILNFIDSGAAFPVSDIVYEMEFTEPEAEAGPEFDQSSYRVQVFPDSWPRPGYPLAAITAQGPESSNLTYALYTPDNEKAIAVDPHTGELFLASSLSPGDEFCTLLVVRDQFGQEKSVPVAINTGGPRRECVNFDITGLSSSTYHGPHRGSIGPWFPIGPLTSQTEAPPTTYTTSPDISPHTPPTSRPSVATLSPVPDTTTVTVLPSFTTTASSSATSSQAWTTSTVIDMTPSTEAFPTPSEAIPPEETTVEATTATISESPASSTESLATGFTPQEGTPTTSARVQPTSLRPISPDISPETPPTSWTSTTATAPPLVTITPDSHPSPITFTTSEGIPTPPPTLTLPGQTATATAVSVHEASTARTSGTSTPGQTPGAVETTTKEYIHTITPDSSPETVAQTWTEPVTEITQITHSVSVDHTSPTVETTTEELIPSGVTIFPPEATTRAEPRTTSRLIASGTPDVSVGPTEGVVTVSPDWGATDIVPPTIPTPIIIPTGGGFTLATFATTTRAKTTLDPYYGVACSKRGEPIWDLICELSKATVRRD